MSALQSKISHAALQQLSLAWQSGLQYREPGNLDMRRKRDVANALTKRVPIPAVVVGEVKRTGEERVQLLAGVDRSDIDSQPLGHALVHYGLTSHKISCREPDVHATKHMLPTADTGSVNVRLARGRLHRLVRWSFANTRAETYQIFKPLNIASPATAAKNSPK